MSPWPLSSTGSKELLRKWSSPPLKRSELSLIQTPALGLRAQPRRPHPALIVSFSLDYTFIYSYVGVSTCMPAWKTSLCVHDQSLSRHILHVLCLFKVLKNGRLRDHDQPKISSTFPRRRCHFVSSCIYFTVSSNIAQITVKLPKTQEDLHQRFMMWLCGNSGRFVTRL